MNFVSFLVLNAAVILRPEEISPLIQGLHLYWVAMTVCLLTNVDQLIRIFSPESLRHRPVLACVIIFVATTVISSIVQAKLTEALSEEVPIALRLLLYFILLVITVDSSERFGIFVGSLALLVFCEVSIALANAYEIVKIESIVPCFENWYDPAASAEVQINRLVGSGIYNDPNDLCLLIGLGILSCLYCVKSGVGGNLFKYFWLLLIPLMAYALTETHSRGGLLGVMAGFGGYLASRMGGLRYLPLVAVGGMLLLTAMGGRQGSIQGGGTAHERLMLWCDGLRLLLTQPQCFLTGLGPGMYAQELGLVAHNSFVHGFVEFGLIGGGAFAGLFYFSLRLLLTMQRFETKAWKYQAKDYAIGLLLGYAMGCYSLSRNEVEPTYMVIGICSVLVEPSTPWSPRWSRVDGRWLVHFVLFSLVALTLIKIATQILTLMGV